MEAEEKFISQIGSAEDTDQAGRESVSFLDDKVLRPLVLADGKARNARPRGCDRTELRSVNDRVTKIEDVGSRQVMVYLYPALVRVLAKHLQSR